jgi:hypothetical protein
MDRPSSPPPSDPLPALPDFVLSTGMRNSLVSYGRRKTVNATPEEEGAKSVGEEEHCTFF